MKLIFQRAVSLTLVIKRVSSHFTQGLVERAPAVDQGISHPVVGTNLRRQHKVDRSRKAAEYYVEDSTNHWCPLYLQWLYPVQFTISVVSLPNSSPIHPHTPYLLTTPHVQHHPILIIHKEPPHSTRAMNGTRRSPAHACRKRTT